MFHFNKLLTFYPGKLKYFCRTILHFALCTLNLTQMNPTDINNNDLKQRLSDIFYSGDQETVGCGCGSGCGCHSDVPEEEMEPCNCDCDSDCDCKN